MLRAREKVFKQQWTYIHYMDDLTLLFFMLTIGVYVLSLFVKNIDRADEVRLCTMMLSICAICCIVTDDSLMTDEIGLLPIFPTVFIMAHSVVGLLKR